jgi:hypothetical protein
MEDVGVGICQRGAKAEERSCGCNLKLELRAILRCRAAIDVAVQKTLLKLLKLLSISRVLAHVGGSAKRPVDWLKVDSCVAEYA